MIHAYIYTAVQLLTFASSIITKSLSSFGCVVAFVLLFGLECTSFAASHFAFDLTFENAWSYCIMNALLSNVKIFSKGYHTIIY
jgi:hypothetical protein